MRILSFDISGACIGWAYGVDGALEAYGKHIVKQSSPKGKRFVDYGQWLIDLFTAKHPDIILVERPYRGRNSNVLVSLSKYIAILEYCAYKVLGLVIQDQWFIDARLVKRTLKVPRGRDHDDNKRLMVLRINELYNLKLKYAAKKSKSYNDDDLADGIAVLTTWWALNG